MKDVLKKALKELKPSKEEKKKIMGEINRFVSKLNKNLKDAEAILGGSRAKDTWIKGTSEADIFARFDYLKYKNRSQEISDILQDSLIKAGFEFNRLHGSRDYFQVKEKGFTFEIVPILKISKASMAVNITDISPLHSEFVGKHKKYADDIRLAKQFCKSAMIYGAESHIGGFSGYVLEILVINYGGFENLLKNAAKWKKSEIVDFKKYHKNVFMDMNKSKLLSPLIVVDPVDPSRNAAAALSREKYELMISKAKEFLKKPGIDYFVKKEIDAKYLKSKFKGKNLILIKVIGGKGKRDVIGGKIKKAFDFIHGELKDYGIIENGWYWDEKDGFFWFVLKNMEINPKEKRTGPPAKEKWHVDNFKKKYKDTFVEDGKICAYALREFCSAKEHAKSLIKHKYVKEKVKEIELI